jgi:hypothetical protein
MKKFKLPPYRTQLSHCKVLQGNEPSGIVNSGESFRQFDDPLKEHLVYGATEVLQ